MERAAFPAVYVRCGQSFDSVFANANGSVTFGEGMTSANRFEFRRAAARGGLWDDESRRRGRHLSQTNSTFTCPDGVPDTRRRLNIALIKLHPLRPTM
jgi:hypothetical protein